MDPRLEAAIGAAKAGGEVALRYFRSGLPVELKSDRSPVTRADRECEERIVAALRSAYPEYGIVGEEFGRHGDTDGAPTWIIDPIDGTKNFIRGIPYFATLIGLEEEGEITAGVVYSPATGDLLYAEKGHGAFDGSGRIRVSPVPTQPNVMI